MRTSLACVIITALISGSLSAEPLHPGRIDPSWNGLGFGLKKEQVLDFLRNRVAQRFEAQIRQIRDVRIQEALKRQMEKEIANIGADFVEFTGQRTGWDVSVVKDEFAHGTGEAMLHLQEGKDHYYFFFTNDVFYKMIKTRIDVPMAVVVEEATKTYGPAGKVEYQDPVSRSGVRFALWQQGLLAASVEDRTRLYQCVVIKWVLREADQAVRARWEQAKGKGSGLNPLVREASEPFEAKETYNPVDEMLGRTPAPAEAPPPPAPKKKPRKK